MGYRQCCQYSLAINDVKSQFVFLKIIPGVRTFDRSAENAVLVENFLMSIPYSSGTLFVSGGQRGLYLDADCGWLADSLHILTWVNSINLNTSPLHRRASS
jgi:hypothetical protein